MGKWDLFLLYIQALKVKHDPVLNKKNAAGETPLMLAAQNSKLDNIKQLIQLGANLNHEEELPDPADAVYWEKIEKVVLAKEISSKVNFFVSVNNIQSIFCSWFVKKSGYRIVGACFIMITSSSYM